MRNICLAALAAVLSPLMLCAGVLLVLCAFAERALGGFASTYNYGAWL